MATFTGTLPTVGIRVVLQDAFTQAGAAVTGSMRNMMTQAKGFTAAATAVAGANLGWAASGYMLGTSLIGMVERGAKVIQTIAAVGAASDATRDQLSQLSKLGEGIAQNSPFGPQQIFTSMREFALAGYKPAELMNLMKPAVELAAANGAALDGTAGSVELLSNTLKSFNINASEAARVSDMLTRAAVDSNVNLLDMRESLKMVSSTASTLNLPLEDILAFTMILGNAGLKGTIAGVGMENFLRYLEVAVNQIRFGDKKKAGKMLEGIGLAPEDILTSGGNLKSLTDILGVFENRLSGFDPSARFKILHDIFGVRGLRAGIKAMQGMGEFAKFKASIMNSSGTGASMMEKVMDNIGGTIQKLKASWAQFEMVFTKSIAPLLSPVLTTLRVIINGLSMLASIPILGPGFITMLTILISGKALLWGYRMILSLVGAGHIQAGTSGAKAGASIATSWAGATASVKAYIAAVKMAYYQGATSSIARTGAASSIFAMGAGGLYRRDPINGGTTLVAGMRHAANIKGMAAVQTAKNGRLYYKNAMGGISWMPKNMANTVKRSMSYATATGAGVAGATVGATVLKGGKLLSLLRAGTMAMGGPGMLALMAISFLPSIIESIRGNSASTDANTQATMESSQMSREYLAFLMNQGQSMQNSRKLFKQIGDSRSATEDYRLEQEKRQYLLHPEQFGTNKPFYDFTQKGTVNIWVNGNLQKSFKEQFNKEITAAVDLIQ